MYFCTSNIRTDAHKCAEIHMYSNIRTDAVPPSKHLRVCAQGGNAEAASCTGRHDGEKRAAFWRRTVDSEQDSCTGRYDGLVLRRSAASYRSVHTVLRGAGPRQSCPPMQGKTVPIGKTVYPIGAVLSVQSYSVSLCHGAEQLHGRAQNDRAAAQGLRRRRAATCSKTNEDLTIVATMPRKDSSTSSSGSPKPPRDVLA